MPSVKAAVVPLLEARHRSAISLRIGVPPRADWAAAPLIDDTANPDPDASVAPVQLLESHEYRYEWDFSGVPAVPVVTDPEEIFHPDSDNGLTGRLRPGLATGLLHVVLRAGANKLGELDLEVRSRKLAYRSEYRWMLRDIVDQMTELVMEKFAASLMHLEYDPTRDAATLYQRFEFLRALLCDEAVEAAFEEIRRRPHVTWEEQHELAHPGRALRASGNLGRSLTRAGKRIGWEGGPIASLPIRILTARTEATLDNTPNRFVRFALERWRQIVADLQDALRHASGAPSSRGLRETDALLKRLDAMLHDELFKDIGSLGHFPANDQVLHRREGYRDIFRAYIEFELAAKLTWQRDEATYQAGQRDVADLYEFWAFLQLASVVAELVGTSFDLASLLDVQPHGLGIRMRRGIETVLAGTVQRHQRNLRVELCFNRTFAAGADSWTLPMRPDYSLIIASSEGESAAFEPVILHFDAKYRVSSIEDIFASGGVGTFEQFELEGRYGERRNPKRVDLLKMHAYRDAIRCSAGAYVIYPGSDLPGNTREYPEFCEVLPGLGAFVLRPSATDQAAGLSSLRSFIDRALDHVAERFSRHERGRYWVREIYDHYGVGADGGSIFHHGFPRDDTSVLLGFVKSTDHWKWIQQRQTYNVRAVGRVGGVEPNAGLLYSQLILLYGPSIELVAMGRIVSGPQRISCSAIAAIGYPKPRGDYLCVQVGHLQVVPFGAVAAAAEVCRIAKERTGVLGQPVEVRWKELQAAIGFAS